MRWAGWQHSPMSGVPRCRVTRQEAILGEFVSLDSGFAGPVLLDDLHCAGDEARLVDCPHAPIGQHNCAHAEDVVLTCQRGPLGDAGQ